MRAGWVLMVLLAGCGKEMPPPAACADLMAACHAGDWEVRVDQKPSGLHPFLLTVRAPNAAQVQAEFAMQGMEMGLNRYRLEHQANGEWQGRVTLPVCVSGRRDWLLVLEVDGERRALAFSVN